MRTAFSRPNPLAGNTLLGVVFIGGLMGITIAATVSLSGASLRNAYRRVAWTQAFYHAENALVWAAQQSVDTLPAAGSSNYYSTANATLVLPYMLAAGTNSGFSNAWVSVVQPTTALANCVVITASAKVNNVVRTLQARVTLYPPSQVFDYEYFLNNWGWWWGSTITGNGAQRANWDFDFQGLPQVNGLIYARDKVEMNEIPYNMYTEGPPFGGLAGADPLDLVHPGVPQVPMPNLLNFSNYVAAAMTDTSTNGLWVGTTQIVFGVHNNLAQPGLYVVGTDASPITIKGTAEVHGDVVISGKVTGRGALYVGGNLYVAGDLTYAHGPNFSTPPETMLPSARDFWVTTNANADLIAYAVRGSIFGGDVTCGDWINWCYWFGGSGLAYVGDESQLGADGIAGTPDDGIPFLHADGTWSAWYDADGDGKVGHNYVYDTDINMNAARAASILNYPTNSDGTPQAFNQVATDNMGSIDGILYCNHAVAMRMANPSSVWHGTIVSRNEQIVFQSVLTFNYDSRVNSRYHNNPNSFINLGLPWGKAIQIDNFTELAPNWANL